MERLLSQDKMVYIAAVIDTMGSLKVRSTPTGDLPSVTVSTPNKALLAFLSKNTGTGYFETTRKFDRHSCTEHCIEPHQVVTSRSQRWQLTGVRATMLLNDCLPHLYLQEDKARELLRLGVDAPHKPATIKKMQALGWSVPWKWAA